MFDLGEHATFIWLAYAAVAIVLSALVIWLRADLRTQQALLAELEARRQRPAANTPDKPPVRKQGPRKMPVHRRTARKPAGRKPVKGRKR